MDVVAKMGSVSAVNEVRLVGRVSKAPQHRELPSGDGLLEFRVVVDRPAGSQRGRQRIDVIDCVVWGGRLLRTVRAWSAGDVVDVTGHVRRRFFRTAVGAGSRVEVEVRTARLIRRSASA
ncbi:single-stranded DNA-binding protein [Nocardioides panacihumi]|uniref:Single-stranded DNA-binding protein n=1 Tax=Nocardioides panacihumi TaxID=400774 RepID=A0ABN2RVW6_9ACTN